MKSISYINYYYITMLLISCCEASAMEEDCALPSAWHSHKQVPAPTFEFPKDKDCSFYLWAWNSFLWITNPSTQTPSKLRFETFPTLQLLAMDNELVNPIRTSQPKTVVPSNSNSNSSNSAIWISTFDVLQAGSNMPLIRSHRDNRKGKSFVYYSTNLNWNLAHFIRDNKLFMPSHYANFPANQPFAVGSMQLKYAWVVVDDADKFRHYYTTQAWVSKSLHHENGLQNIRVHRQELKLVALVGMHIVGFVDGHPEAIWATFEHKRNAPPLHSETPLYSIEPVSDLNWLFYESGTPTSKATQQMAATPSLDTPLVATNVYRLHPWGQADTKHIQMLSKLESKISKQLLAEDSVWNNYFLVGAVWGVPFQLQPDQSIAPGIGSPRLANTAIETYTQSLGCFSCHTTFASEKDGIVLPAKLISMNQDLKNFVRWQIEQKEIMDGRNR